MGKVYVGLEVCTKKYGSFKVVGNLGSSWYIVEFCNGYKKRVQHKSISTGNISNPTFPTIYGRAYLGEGEYKATVCIGGVKKNTPAYEVWNGMIKRCYNPKSAAYTRYGGRGVKVHPSWYNYQVFAEWYYKTRASVSENIRLELDKDLTDGIGDMYSPETCTFVPNCINSIFSGGRGKGVTFNKEKGLWVVQVHVGELTKSGKPKQTYLGGFMSEKEATHRSAEAKTDYIIAKAIEYKGYISKKVYSNLTDVGFIHMILNKGG